MSPALLEIRGISSGYGARPVLSDLTMNVASGEFVAIIGPNGHGKTTLLRTISGLLPVQSGEIRFDGRRLDRLRPDQIVAAGVIHVPQGDMLFPEMTVLENLMMGAYCRRSPAEIRRALEEVFALLPKLAERRAQLASTLSGGERRMVGIGRGLMAGGRVLMLDEPSLGLAPIIIDQIYQVVERLKADGRTLILVEENTARVADTADHIHLLDNGRFVWEGAGRDLMSRPEILTTYLGG
ncbi:MAG TPA: ABC transporter ATP-binding protein [Verrucomicrobiae bacterium]|nr:ABC transporter ATP-binding protein [Verrucomicrobiae bacterium]